MDPESDDPAVGKFIFEIPREETENAEKRRDAENLLKRMQRFIASDRKRWAFWIDEKKLVFRSLYAAR
jgi:hypothetical protein